MKRNVKNLNIRKSHAEIEPIIGKAKHDESNLAILACNDFLRMGRARSITALARSYKKQAKIAEDKGQVANVPTKSQGTLYVWSSNYNWSERAETYDAVQEEKRNREAERIMQSGLATTHERVHTLNHLAQAVLNELSRRGLYGVTVKGIGSGDDFERVEEEVFRKDEIIQIRGLVDDIAKEVGGREKRVGVEVTGLAGLLSGASGFDEQVEEAKWEDVTDEDDAPATGQDAPGETQP